MNATRVDSNSSSAEVFATEKKKKKKKKKKKRKKKRKRSLRRAFGYDECEDCPHPKNVNVRKCQRPKGVRGARRSTIFFYNNTPLNPPQSRAEH